MLAGGCRVDGDVRGGLVGGGVEGRPRVAGAGRSVRVGVRGAADHLGSTEIIENECIFCISYREHSTVNASTRNYSYTEKSRFWFDDIPAGSGWAVTHE